MASIYSDAHIAHVCHEANRALQRMAGEDKPSPPWGQASREQRESALAGVALARRGHTPEQLHKAWCDHKRSRGWQWGPVKDERARRHPCLVPYEQLPPEQRAKDAVFSAIVQALG